MISFSFFSADFPLHNRHHPYIDFGRLFSLILKPIEFTYKFVDMWLYMDRYLFFKRNISGLFFYIVKIGRTIIFVFIILVLKTDYKFYD